MQRSKSPRHQRAANARWRAAEQRAQAERDADIADRARDDCRRPIDLDLSTAGGRHLVLEPRLGYVAWRVRDADTGEVIACAALKTVLHTLADSLPRWLGSRNLG